MFNYIYLDDESIDAVGPYIDAVVDMTTNLRIQHMAPDVHSDQIRKLRGFEKTKEIDGLILDLRLDQKVNNHIRADYRATTLAQEIRTRATEGLLGEYPIVLWSTDEKLNQSYVKDDTGHDLFDLKIVKRDILDAEKASHFARKLVALVEGYQDIIKIKQKTRTNIQRFLGFEELPTFLDPRVLTPIDERKGVLPAHEYARFIIKELLEIPGPLINEYLLAARLGINLQESPDFFELTTKYFDTASYTGPFSKGWPRWWASAVYSVWKNFKNCPGSLRNLDADLRVKFLKKLSGLKKLVPAKVEHEFHHTTFWTICQATLMPLDPKDGFLIDRQPSYPWQDKLYVSLGPLLNGEAAQKRIKIDPLEVSRFTKVKSKLGGK